MVWHPNAMRGASSRWVPQRNARHVRKMSAQTKNRSTTTSWTMDKNKFSLGGRIFNTASPRLGAPTQCKAHPQVGRPNTMQGKSASWVPQRNATHVRKLGAQTQRKASSQDGCQNEKLIRNENVDTREH